MKLYLFRYRNPLTGKWVRARYVAERHEIAARHKEWEITGTPEVREGGQSGYFPPFRPAKAPPSNMDRSPMLDDADRF